MGWPLQYRVSGPDKDEVRRLALEFANVVGTDARTRHVHFDWMEPARQLRVKINQDQARQLGVSSAAIAGVLNAAISGTPVTQVRDDIYLVNAVVRAADGERASFQTLASLQVPTPSGRMVPLQQFASFVEEQEFPLVWRRDRVPTLTVRADVNRGVLPDDRGAGAGAEGRRVQRQAAQPLQGRDRRPVRGEPDLAGVGVRGGSADDRADAAGDDGHAGQLPPPG